MHACIFQPFRALPAFLGSALCLFALSASADTVSALGRVHPVSGVINLFGPEGSTINEIHVAEGDWVEPGQLLLTTSGNSSARANLQRAEQELNLERERQEQLAAGIEIRIAGLSREVDITRKQFDRIQQSDTAKFAAPDLLLEREIALIRATNALDFANQEARIHKVEASIAIAAAEARLAEAEQRLQATRIRAPAETRVLKMLARPGDTIAARELFKLGDTRQMLVVAEVYEADADRVEPGQTARISSSALEADLSGRVISTGWMIFKDTVDSLDPTQLTNARVVEAIILLDDADPVRRRVMMQVDVEIDV